MTVKATPIMLPFGKKVVGDTLVCNETSFDSIRQDQFNNLVLLMLTNTISSLKMQLGGYELWSSPTDMSQAVSYSHCFHNEQTFSITCTNSYSNHSNGVDAKKA